MKKEKQESEIYTIEREFLGEITVTELLSRIIRTHLLLDEDKIEDDIKPAQSDGKPDRQTYPNVNGTAHGENIS